VDQGEVREFSVFGWEIPSITGSFVTDGPHLKLEQEKYLTPRRQGAG
jgi:hypothetical protein